MKRCMVLVFLAGALAGPAMAHPHVMIESRMEFDMDGSSCRGFWLDWEFDAFFGASVIYDYDINRDGKFDEAETREVYDGAFRNLEKYGYFVILRKGSTHGSIKKITSFSATIRDGILAYRFYVPLEGTGFELNPVVSIFDVTFFCSIICPEDGITVTRTRDVPVAIQRGLSKKPVYYDPFGAATDNRIHDRWRQGLQTAYPEEIGIINE